jgi:hypothetical protein
MKLLSVKISILLEMNSSALFAGENCKISNRED